MRAFGLIALGIGIVLASGQSSLRAKEPSKPRRVKYGFVKEEAFVIVTVQETAKGAKGDVVFTRGPTSDAPSFQGTFQISHAEFEQIWSTLNAPGVEKSPYSGNEYEVEDRGQKENAQRPTLNTQRKSENQINCPFGFA